MTSAHMYIPMDSQKQHEVHQIGKVRYKYILGDIQTRERQKRGFIGGVDIIFY